MEKEILTFNDLPQVVAQLRDEVMGMRAMLTRQQAESSKPAKENLHKPMTVEEAIEYTHIPRGTMYMKLEDGTIPWQTSPIAMCDVGYMRLLYTGQMVLILSSILSLLLLKPQNCVLKRRS